MKNEAISSPRTTHRTALGNSHSDLLTGGVRAVLSRKRDCFGAPYVCAPSSMDCLGCCSRVKCAETAIKMVFAVSAGDLELKGIIHDRRSFVNSVGVFLPEGYTFPKMPLDQDDLNLVESCYARSKHLLPADDLTDSALDTLCAELGLPEANLPAQSLRNAAQKEHSTVARSNVVHLRPTTPNSSAIAARSGSRATGASATGGGEPQSVAVAPALDECRFPSSTELNEIRFHHLCDEELALELSRQLGERDETGRLRSYENIRNDVCAIAIVMNSRRIVPPAFRAQRALPRKIKGKKTEASPEQTLMMRDRQIIDLHWLHCNDERRRLDKGEFENLLAGEAFDFGLAERFASKGWALGVKASKVLKLTDYEQWQMAIFRTDAVRDDWRNAEHMANHSVERRLREHAVRDPAFGQYIWDLKLLWLADKIANDWGQKVVAEVFGWLKGEPPLASSTLSAKLKRMRRRTTSPRKPN